VCINRESAQVLAGLQWRPCERRRGHESASRGCKSANKGCESACIALESATGGLEIVGETVRGFSGPLSKRGHVRVVEAMKVPVETIRVLIKAVIVPISVVEVPKEAVIVL
jgi:hypothetical protein